MNYFLNDCTFDFSSDNINIIMLLYDYSGSMTEHKQSMLKANMAFQQDFSKFEDKGSIAISKGSFNAYFSMAPFQHIKHFDTSYYADGGTALYSSIVKAAQNTIDYYNEIIKRLNARPRITFLVFSDGEDNENQYSTTARDRCKSQAKASIMELNSLDATTVFVAFGDAIENETGNILGFTCTKNITTVQELISCLGNELSKSCKEQSRSLYSLKSEFFSKANKDSADDNAGDQAIIDDDFFGV